MTPNDLILLALKQTNVLGVGQAAQAEDLSDAFTLLQMMLAQWQRRRYAVYHLIDVVKQSTGAQSYTWGTGGDINSARPAKIEAAFARMPITNAPYQVDYMLEILRAREDYDRILIKGMPSFPRYCFYDSAYPLGNVFVWPVPSDVFELHFTVMAQLQQFATAYDEFNMPPEYQEAIMYNLALRLYPMYGLPVNPSVLALAKSSMNILEAANAQIPRLVMPQELRARGTYNIYADRVN